MKELQIGAPVRDLQHRLQLLAEKDSTLPPLVADGVYGEQTASAVRAFQKGHGLPVTGNTDQDTWEMIFLFSDQMQADKNAPMSLALFPAVDAQIDLNSNLPVVWAIQIVLNAFSHHFCDFQTVAMTGVYDADTKQGVTRFQHRAKLPQTGVTDKNTWNHMTMVYRLVQQEDLF